MKMKCTACGSEEFIRFPILTGLDIDMHVQPYCCTNCHHIELYANNDEVMKIQRRISEENKRKEIENNNMIRAAELRSELEQCKRIVNDENQTVKAVREATQRATEIENELSHLPTPSERGVMRL